VSLPGTRDTLFFRLAPRFQEKIFHREVISDRQFLFGAAMKRGAPSFSNDQREEVLRLLREAKARGLGVNKAVLLFEYRYTQCATRVFELEQQGYVIEHRSIPGERFVTFFLVSEPEHLKPLPIYQPKGSDPRQGTLANSPDWYERQTDKPRGSEDNSVTPGPLFAGASSD
jgi:hypothetical protein